MSKNIFFKSKGPFKLNKLFPNTSNTKILIKDVKTLDQANQFDLTFFDSLDYKKVAENTRAAACITKESLTHFLPKKCQKIIVKSVLYELAKVVQNFIHLRISIFQMIRLKNQVNQNLKE